MNKHKRRLTLQVLLLVLSLAAILLLAGGLPDLRFQPGEDLHLYEWILASIASLNSADYWDISESPPESILWSRLGQGTRDILIITFWLTLIFSIIYAFVSQEFRRELFRMFLFILPLVLLLPYIASMVQKELNPAEEGGLAGDFSLGDTAFPEPPLFVQQPPGWFLRLAQILILSLFILGIYLIWRRLRPKRGTEAVVVENIRQALSALESGSELKDVVIACYAKMCRELQHARGVRRHKAMTPHEFEKHLANSGITSAHIRQLTLLFEGVRYGAKPTDQAVEQTAIQSLQAILEAYGE